MRAEISGLLALALAWAFSPQARAAEVLAYPQWNSTQIRAARPLAPEDALVFDLHTEEIGGHASGRVAVSTVTLTASYTQVVTGNAHLLDDHALCRVLSWSDDKSAVDSESCYALPAFRVIELSNRHLLAGVLGAVVKDSPLATASPYWAEAELAVQEQPSDPLVRRATPGGVAYTLGDETVVRLSVETSKLADAEAKWVVRYFANHQPLHPQVRRELGTGGSLPARIEIETRAAGDKRWLVLTVSNVRRAKLAYPLPVALESALRLSARDGDTTVANGLHQAILAIDGKSKIERPSPEALLGEMQEAATGGRPIDVTLLFLQFVQQYGALFKGSDAPTLLNRLRPLLLAAEKDSAASRLLDANRLAGGSKETGDREAAARYLAFASDLDRLPFGTFRYVTFANLVANSKDSTHWDPQIFKAMPSPLVRNYWVHIAAYPWASNAYKDAGDADFANYDMQRAWLAYDLGRAVDKGWRESVMSAVGTLEDKLRNNQPDFF